MYTWVRRSTYRIHGRSPDCENQPHCSHLFIPAQITRSDRSADRGHKSHKAYIALFVCLMTKALYLEFVSDYFSSTFIAAYQCFLSRREGTRVHIFRQRNHVSRRQSEIVRCTCKQMIQRLTEDFWKAWFRDYLHSLQQHPKWRIVQQLANIGQIVLVRNPLASLSQSKLGRITACHSGKDGLIRVITVKTNRFEYKRSVVKLFSTCHD